MVFDWLKEIQEQMYTTLSDAELTVYDFVPDNEHWPYVTFGDPDTAAFDTQEYDGAEITYPIHVWHRPEDRGKAPVLEIQQTIYDLLHKTDFTLTCGSVVSMRFLNAEIVVDPDNVTYHGIQRFRILIGGK